MKQGAGSCHSAFLFPLGSDKEGAHSFELYLKVSVQSVRHSSALSFCCFFLSACSVASFYLSSKRKALWPVRVSFLSRSRRFPICALIYAVSLCPDCAFCLH